MSDSVELHQAVDIKGVRMIIVGLDVVVVRHLIESGIG